MSDISDQNEKMVSQLQFGKCNLSQEHAADGNQESSYRLYRDICSDITAPVNSALGLPSHKV